MTVQSTAARGRPRKPESARCEARHNVRLTPQFDAWLREISAETGIPPETLLRSFAQAGIREQRWRLLGGDDHCGRAA